MSEIWESVVADGRAVLHGKATRYIVWRKDDNGNWRMIGATWSRARAEEMLE